LERERIGRQNCYVIHTGKRLRHQLEAHRTIGSLLDLVVPRSSERTDLGGHGSEI
jgi:hypothetical protein